DDERFTSRVVARLEEHLEQALARVGHVLVFTHHPPCYGLNYPRPNGALFLDHYLWDALSGNARVEEVLRRHAGSIPLVCCGHTHHARETTLGPTRGYNVGGDYGFKRLLVVDWPGGEVVSHTFGEEE